MRKQLVLIAVILLTQGITMNAHGQTSQPPARPYTIFRWLNDLGEISKLAYEYRCLPIEKGGGGGSYVGFKIPRNLDSTENGKFSIYDVVPEEIVFFIRVPRKGNFIYVFDSTGRHKRREYEPNGFNPDEFQRNNNTMVGEMRKILAEALKYRKNKGEAVGATFQGFVIPDSLAASADGIYRIMEIRKDTMYVRATSTIGIGFLYFEIAHTGVLHALTQGEYRPPR